MVTVTEGSTRLWLNSSGVWTKRDYETPERESSRTDLQRPISDIRSGVRCIESIRNGLLTDVAALAEQATSAGIAGTYTHVGSLRWGYLPPTSPNPSSNHASA